jgi:hypothetical protein
MAHGRIEPMGRLVRSWRKLTCERSGGIRVLMWWTAPAPGDESPLRVPLLARGYVRQLVGALLFSRLAGRYGSIYIAASGPSC